MQSARRGLPPKIIYYSFNRISNAGRIYSTVWRGLTTENASPDSVRGVRPQGVRLLDIEITATGYDVVLGTGSKKENGETRPYQYGNHKKLNLKEGTVTATFKNVPKGTWVVGMHAFNRTSEDGKKVFSPWSNLKKATVR